MSAYAATAMSVTVEIQNTIAALVLNNARRDLVKDYLPQVRAALQNSECVLVKNFMSNPRDGQFQYIR